MDAPLAIATLLFLIGTAAWVGWALRDDAPSDGRESLAHDDLDAHRSNASGGGDPPPASPNDAPRTFQLWIVSSDASPDTIRLAATLETMLRCTTGSRSWRLDAAAALPRLQIFNTKRRRSAWRDTPTEPGAPLPGSDRAGSELDDVETIRHREVGDDRSVSGEHPNRAERGCRLEIAPLAVHHEPSHTGKPSAPAARQLTFRHETQDGPVFRIRADTPAFDAIIWANVGAGKRQNTANRALARQLLTAHMWAAHASHVSRGAPAAPPFPIATTSEIEAEQELASTDPDWLAVTRSQTLIANYTATWMAMQNALATQPAGDPVWVTLATRLDEVLRQAERCEADGTISPASLARLMLNCAVVARRQAVGRQTYLALQHALDATDEAVAILQAPDRIDRDSEDRSSSDETSRAIVLAAAQERHRILSRLAELEGDPGRRDAALAAASLGGVEPGVPRRAARQPRDAHVASAEDDNNSQLAAAPSFTTARQQRAGTAPPATSAAQDVQSERTPRLRVVKTKPRD